MFKLNTLLPTLTLGAFAMSAITFASPDDVVPVDCEGCDFTLVGPTHTVQGPGACQTDVRITIMYFDGSCEDAGNGDGCQPEAPCFAGIDVEYRSLCPVTLDYIAGPNGALTGTLPLPATPGGMWTDVIPPWLETLPCGSPTYVLHALLTDPAGGRAWATANYWCNACD